MTTDLFTRIVGSFFMAGIAAAASVIIDSAQNFGKQHGMSPVKLNLPTWENYRDYGKARTQPTPPPPTPTVRSASGYSYQQQAAAPPPPPVPPVSEYFF